MDITARYLLQNMDWLEEELGGYDDDYLIFDCPGQHSFTCSFLDPDASTNRSN
jgi:hypothetical protein